MADLASRISLTGPPPSAPEDFLAGAFASLDPDDTPNIHGDAEHGILYTSPHLKAPLALDLAEPAGDDQRRLFSHYLWNAALLLAELVEAGSLPLDAPASGALTPHAGLTPGAFDVRGAAVIELGAGTALPSILAALVGASRVVATDYPAPAIIDTLRENVARNTTSDRCPPGREPTPRSAISIEGHAWGDLASPFAAANKHAFDRVLAADGLWMPWVHDALRESISWFLGEGPAARAWVLAGFHTGRATMRGFFEPGAMADAHLEVEAMWERDVDGKERPWVAEKAHEEVGGEKRWLLIAVLRRPRSKVDAS
ncbi:hypothetical protein F5X68DRAFT_159680 [Plectosphaerella plurivora]|uniref:Nicotinamide N-methyltransferase n=1 Tax=Plectosphaerella plurivora TaxID=936078 RepID=A0A9P9A5V1_9PEZI|nr:hypothetical protein F5X68DRAFT_159680 [Plectosphaerella plurivora]